jgi:hypothetical protein
MGQHVLPASCGVHEKCGRVLLGMPKFASSSVSTSSNLHYPRNVFTSQLSFSTKYQITDKLVLVFGMAVLGLAAI